MPWNEAGMEQKEQTGNDPARHLRADACVHDRFRKRYGQQQKLVIERLGSEISSLVQWVWWYIRSLSPISCGPANAARKFYEFLQHSPGAECRIYGHNPNKCSAKLQARARSGGRLRGALRRSTYASAVLRNGYFNDYGFFVGVVHPTQLLANRHLVKLGSIKSERKKTLSIIDHAATLQEIRRP
ncbi:hypothetical protein EVAR_48729_1 [Eumeta japonica]|uniref:Uncharacterized protein n=1 Tax=Eumeta variegata TaxID=151549 RepID=A0A4C1YK97_EUMVA|nr:hypothetical protein EVAR_48729_1 [Eumeta japonica]